MIIGDDPQKSSHGGRAVDPATNTAVASVRVEASIAGYRTLLGWARPFGERRGAMENARGLGCHLAQWLVARDEVVFDVATTATSRGTGAVAGWAPQERRDRRICGGQRGRPAG